jgi:hypothetical protein
MAKFKALVHITHDGTMHQPGQEIELNPKEVDIDRLLEMNAVEPIEEEKKAPKKKADQKADENPGE